MKLLVLVLIVFSSILSTQSYAQEVSDSTQVAKKYYLIVKNDGNEYYGYIIKDDGREILLETKSIGNIYINKSQIREIKEVEESKDSISKGSGEYSDLREQGPFTTRYYFTTNALPIKKKENYALIHLYGPEVHFAVTDNLSIGVMATWIASPIALAAKYSFTNNNPDSDLHFSIGTIVGSGGYLAPTAFGGLHFATLTKGDRMSNMSFSAGFAHVNLNTGSGPTNLGSKYNLYLYDNIPYNATPVNANVNVQEYITASSSKNNGSFVFGLSGIKSIGKKASFIFDSMVFITNKKSVTYQPIVEAFTYTEEVYDPLTENYITTTATQNYTIGEGQLVSSFKPTIILMPGMRFNNKYGSAIQVVLSGVIFERTNWNGETNYQGIPIPMVSWLKAF